MLFEFPLSTCALKVARMRGRCANPRMTARKPRVHATSENNPPSLCNVLWLCDSFRTAARGTTTTRSSSLGQWKTKVMFFFFFVFHFPLLCEPECRSDCVADRSFKTALNACAAPVDHGRPSWLPIPKACTSSRGPSCSKHIARYIALFGSLSAGEEFLNIGHLQTHTKTFAMVPGTLGRTLYRVVNRK